MTDVFSFLPPAACTTTYGSDVPNLSPARRLYPRRMMTCAVPACAGPLELLSCRRAFMASSYGILSHSTAGLPAGEQAIRRRRCRWFGGARAETVSLRADLP
eukprot:scaffold9139_cov64-Phaeocystis_antarctica.AAC.12